MDIKVYPGKLKGTEKKAMQMVNAERIVLKVNAGRAKPRRAGSSEKQLRRTETAGAKLMRSRSLRS